MTISAQHTEWPYGAAELIFEQDGRRWLSAVDPTTQTPVIVRIEPSGGGSPAFSVQQQFRQLTAVAFAHSPRVLDYGFTPSEGEYLVLDAAFGRPLETTTALPSQILAWLCQIHEAIEALQAVGHHFPLLHLALLRSNDEGRACLLDVGLPRGDRAVAEDLQRQTATSLAVWLADILSPWRAPAPAEKQSKKYSATESATLDRLLNWASEILAPENRTQLHFGSALKKLTGDTPAGHHFFRNPPFFEPRLWNYWTRHRGQPGPYVWCGPRGAGKSRTLHEAYRHLRSEGEVAVFLKGTDSGTPLGLLEQLWRWGAARCPAALTRVPRPLRSLLASVWPWAFPDDPPHDDPARTARVLPEVLAALLRQAALGAPLHILVDDWGHVDKESQSILTLISQGDPGCHLLVTAAEKPENFSDFALEALDISQTQTWLARWLEFTPEKEWARSVWYLGAGYPGVMTEIVTAPGPMPAQPGSIPPEMESQLSVTWHSLTAEQRGLMSILALQGGRCAPEDFSTAQLLLPPDWPLDLQTLTSKKVLRQDTLWTQFTKIWWQAWTLAHETPVRLARLTSELHRLGRKTFAGSNGTEPQEKEPSSEQISVAIRERVGALTKLSHGYAERLELLHRALKTTGLNLGELGQRTYWFKVSPEGETILRHLSQVLPQRPRLMTSIHVVLQRQAATHKLLEDAQSALQAGDASENLLNELRVHIQQLVNLAANFQDDPLLARMFPRARTETDSRPSGQTGPLSPAIPPRSAHAVSPTANVGRPSSRTEPAPPTPSASERQTNAARALLQRVRPWYELISALRSENTTSGDVGATPSILSGKPGLKLLSTRLQGSPDAYKLTQRCRQAYEALVSALGNPDKGFIQEAKALGAFVSELRTHPLLSDLFELALEVPHNQVPHRPKPPERFAS